MSEFKAAKIGEKFDKYLSDFKLIIKNNEAILGDLENQMKKELDLLKKRVFLTVAFIGEYSAGKSTIVSALTSRRDIKISADIATDRITEYDWNRIKLIDTPGLYTHRKDHDEITYDAIRQSDLLVFCLTHSLFDSITSENFKYMAFEENFRQKMMLVINKMSSEAGDEEQKINSYKDSISKALEPYNPEEFPICFIDALDYVDGIDENDEELIEISRFGTFIKELNKFVDNKATLARLDTPIRILLSYLNEASDCLSRDTNKDDAYIELLKRLNRIVDRERKNLRTKVRNLRLELTSKVLSIGRNLTNKLGQEKNFEELAKKEELNIQEMSEETSKGMEQVINESIRSLQEEVKDLLNSQLADNFRATIASAEKIEVKSAEQSDAIRRLKKQSENLFKIADKTGLKIREMATGSSGSAVGFITKTTGASGSTLHQGILTVGRAIGYKFKPWEAVKLAKNLGNIMAVVGPALMVVSIIMEIAGAREEAKNEKKLSDARRNLNSQFQSIAQDLELQFTKELRRVESELYKPVEDQINSARRIEEQEKAASDENIKKIIFVRDNLNNLLEEISVVL